MAEFLKATEASGIESVKLPPRSPNLNATLSALSESKQKGFKSKGTPGCR